MASTGHKSIVKRNFQLVLEVRCCHLSDVSVIHTALHILFLKPLHSIYKWFNTHKNNAIEYQAHFMNHILDGRQFLKNQKGSNSRFTKRLKHFKFGQILKVLWTLENVSLRILQFLLCLIEHSHIFILRHCRDQTCLWNLAQYFHSAKRQ